MKNILVKIAVIAICIFLFSCSSTKNPDVTFHLQLKLVDGSIARMSYVARSNSEFIIIGNKGYNLFEIRHFCGGISDSYLVRGAVIDFKIDSITDVQHLAKSNAERN